MTAGPILAVRRGEAGVVVVLVALLTVAVLVVMAIVVDGGQGYADRRQMQNAADAAAFAGARRLSQIRFGGTTGDLAAYARGVAVDNGADPGLVGCDVVNESAIRIAPCSPATGWTARGDAAGVLVTAPTRRATVFGRLAGPSELRPTASGAATLQKLLAARSPFMVCGNPLLGGHDLIDPLTRSLRPESVLRGLYGAAGTALSDPRGIPVAGAVSARCGIRPLWQGFIDAASQPAELGRFAVARAGATVGRHPYDDIVAGVGGCPQDFRDGEAQSCLALIPVFDAVDVVAQSARLAAWALWRIRYDPYGSVRYWGQFVSAGVADGGATSTDPVDGRSTFVVRLAR